MKIHQIYTFILIAILLNPVTISYGQISDKKKPISFEISSLNDKVFIATGFYKGELQIYKDFVKINVNKGIIHIQKLSDYKETRPFIRNIRFGLGINTENGQWNIYSSSLSIIIDKQMDLGERYQLPVSKILIPRNPNIDLERSWLIAIIEVSGEGNTERVGYCYTHSGNIFKDN